MRNSNRSASASGAGSLPTKVYHTDDPESVGFKKLDGERDIERRERGVAKISDVTEEIEMDDHRLEIERLTPVHLERRSDGDMGLHGPGGLAPPPRSSMVRKY